MPYFVPKDPPRDPAECPEWLFETIKRLNLTLSRNVQQVAAIGRGEAPDGSGSPLIDLSKFFYKPGIAGGQLGYGGTNTADNLTLSSTAAAAKGFIYLGTGTARVAFDEVNDFFGIGTDTPDGPLHVHRAAPGTPAIGSFGNEIAEFSTVVSAVETELVRITTYQNNASAYDAAILCNTGAAASGGLYFSSISGVATGIKMSFGTIGGDTLNAAHLQFGGLTSGGAGQNLNGVLCGINDIAGNSLRTAFNYISFRFIAAGVFSGDTRVGVNIDPFDFNGSTQASQPDSLHVARRTSATASVPTLLVEGASSTEMAIAVRLTSGGTTPTKNISALNMAGFRHNGDMILADAGTLRCLLSGATPGGAGTLGFRFIETVGSTNLLRGGKVSAWSDTLAEVLNVYLMLGDTNTSGTTHRAAHLTSTGFAAFTRLGIASAYTLIMNAGAASLQAPETTPTLLRVINSSVSGADASILLKLESQRSGQTADFLEAIDSNGAVRAAILSDGTYYGPLSLVFVDGDAVSYDDDAVFYHPTYQ